MDTTARRTLGGDIAVAVALALGLGLAWTLRDWSKLRQLQLPDTDDLMRLQQVRDWLGGQPFDDLTQHRLAGGLPMHWTRLADLGPALLIAMLRPVVGTYGAEVMAVASWPPVLFCFALLAVGRIARRIEPSTARTAMLVAAIAYPATSVFTPGRIDHHGLQVVLLLVAVAAILAPRRIATGAVLALAAVASFVVGLETAPLFVVLIAIVMVDWARRRADAEGMIAGLGGGLTLGLVIAALIFAPRQFGYPACDGFTASAWRAAAIGAAIPLILAAIGRFLAPRHRPWALGAVGVPLVVAALAISPDCLSPYGRVDPLMARLWLANVGEAQSIRSAPAAASITYLGLMAAGLIAAGWQSWRTGRRGWTILLAIQLGAFVLAAVQLRGAYAGALLSAPALAAMIGEARSRGGTVKLIGAWAASAGMLYPIAAQAFERPASSPTGGNCAAPATLAALATLPAGTVLAPIDAGPAILTNTAHRVVAAPYHRNDAGNLAMFAIYRGDAAHSAASLQHWRVDYVLACATIPGRDRQGSLAARLAAGDPAELMLRARLPDGTTIWQR